MAIELIYKERYDQLSFKDKEKYLQIEDSKRPRYVNILTLPKNVTEYGLFGNIRYSSLHPEIKKLYTRDWLFLLYSLGSGIVDPKYKLIPSISEKIERIRRAEMGLPEKSSLIKPFDPNKVAICLGITVIVAGGLYLALPTLLSRTSK